VTPRGTKPCLVVGCTDTRALFSTLCPRHWTEWRPFVGSPPELYSAFLNGRARDEALLNPARRGES
jgi:hypothetical protein